MGRVGFLACAAAFARFTAAVLGDSSAGLSATGALQLTGEPDLRPEAPPPPLEPPDRGPPLGSLRADEGTPPSCRWWRAVGVRSLRSGAVGSSRIMPAGLGLPADAGPRRTAGGACDGVAAIRAPATPLATASASCSSDCSSAAPPPELMLHAQDVSDTRDIALMSRTGSA